MLTSSVQSDKNVTPRLKDKVYTTVIRLTMFYWAEC